MEMGNLSMHIIESKIVACDSNPSMEGSSHTGEMPDHNIVEKLARSNFSVVIVTRLLH